MCILWSRAIWNLGRSALDDPFPVSNLAAGETSLEGDVYVSCVTWIQTRRLVDGELLP